MKCIGRKYEEIVLWYVFIWVLFGLSIAMTIFMFSEAPYVIVLPIILGACIIWYNYYVFFIPSEIVFYDEENKRLIVYITRKNKKDVSLNDIKNVKLESAGYKTYWYKFTVELKNGETFTATLIDKENEIMETITVINNDDIIVK